MSHDPFASSNIASSLPVIISHHKSSKQTNLDFFLEEERTCICRTNLFGFQTLNVFTLYNIPLEGMEINDVSHLPIQIVPRNQNWASITSEGRVLFVFRKSKHYG